MLDVSRNTVRRYLCSNGLPRYEREARPRKLEGTGGLDAMNSGKAARALLLPRKPKLRIVKDKRVA